MTIELIPGESFVDWRERVRQDGMASYRPLWQPLVDRTGIPFERFWFASFSSDEEAWRLLVEFETERLHGK